MQIGYDLHRLVLDRKVKELLAEYSSDSSRLLGLLAADTLPAPIDSSCIFYENPSKGQVRSIPVELHGAQGRKVRASVSRIAFGLARVNERINLSARENVKHLCDYDNDHVCINPAHLVQVGLNTDEGDAL
jgi:hypothetical protein